MSLENFCNKLLHVKYSIKSESVDLTNIPESEVLREHFIISGKVQHVGFRYEAKRIADELELTGWAKNLPSGEVEMEVQGEKNRIARLISELSKVKRIRLDDIQLDLVDVIEEDEFHALYE